MLRRKKTILFAHVDEGKIEPLVYIWFAYHIGIWDEILPIMHAKEFFMEIAFVKKEIEDEMHAKERWKSSL